MAGYAPKSGPLAGRSFASEGRYRSALAASRGFGSHRQLLEAQARGAGFAGREARLATPRSIRTASQLAGLSTREAEARERALAGFSAMRRDPSLSLSHAAAREHTTPTAIRKYAGGSITEGGRPTPRDRLYRRMRVAVDRGGGLGGDVLLVGVADSRTASMVGRHWHAIWLYLERGDYSALEKFRGRTFTSEGQTYRFLTRRDAIDEMADVGEFTGMDDIYA